MKLSAPVYVLKRRAKDTAKRDGIPLHEALQRIALEEGFTGWSHLAHQLNQTRPSTQVYSQLQPGELVLLGARPGHGKTLLGLELAVEAIACGNPAWFFSLECTAQALLKRLTTLGVDPGAIGNQLNFDNNDALCADYIADQLDDAAPGTIAVVDYLQLLDQRRENAELAAQVSVLKALATRKKLILVLLSQIDRRYEDSAKQTPDITDVRLPNPVDLTLFDRSCFLHKGAVRVESVY